MIRYIQFYSLLNILFLGKPLVTVQYIYDCVKSKRWLNTKAYEWLHQPSITLSKYEPNLVSLPKKCLEFYDKKVTKGIFSQWKVLLHVEHAIKLQAYKRYHT